MVLLLCFGATLHGWQNSQIQSGKLHEADVTVYMWHANLCSSQNLELCVD